jgi:hypothetical protein
VRRRLFVAAVTLVVGLLAVPANAAGSTTVEHFNDGPFPDNICGVSGTTTIRGTSVFRQGEGGAFFASGTFWAIFTAENGKSITIFNAGPSKQISPDVIDQQAGTVTFTVTTVGLPEKLSITNGPTLSLDAGTATFTYVFEYTGNPDDPYGDFISQDVYDVHGPHPDLLSDFEVFCDVLVPYLQDP